MPLDCGLLRKQFEETYGRQPRIVSAAPGRVNLIGEHTDYNDGLVLPAAIDRSVAVAAAGRDDGLIRARSVDYGQSDEFSLERVRRFMGSRGWRDYVRGIAWALQEEQLDLRGADMLISGDVPPGAGLSSSAAVEMAVAGALARLAELDINPPKLALLAQRAENLFVGVQCGIMDQLTSAIGEKDHALLIDCRTLEVEAVAIPQDIDIVVVNSCVQRELEATPYNRRREECGEAAALVGVESLRDADSTLLDQRRRDMPDNLYRRARHVITENDRVRDLAGALAADDREAIGRLMSASHESLRTDFEASTPELDTLVEIAAGVPGVIGARLTGAGFGGCTVNLVEREGVDKFERAIVDGYTRATGLTAEVYRCHASDGLRVIDA
jgi:galactokinase